MAIRHNLYNKHHGQSLSLEDLRAWDVWKIVSISRDHFSPAINAFIT
jgi:hypothetical protein